MASRRERAEPPSSTTGPAGPADIASSHRRHSLQVASDSHLAALNSDPQKAVLSAALRDLSARAIMPMFPVPGIGAVFKRRKYRTRKRTINKYLFLTCLNNQLDKLKMLLMIDNQHLHSLSFA